MIYPRLWPDHVAAALGFVGPLPICRVRLILFGDEADVTAGLAGEERGDDVVLPGDLLGAEAAAHVLGDDPYAVLRQRQLLGRPRRCSDDYRHTAALSLTALHASGSVDARSAPWRVPSSI